MALDLMRFNPFKDTSPLESWKNMDEVFKNFNLAPWSSVNAEPRIKVDVSETDTEYAIKADIPGAKKEDIKVMVDGNQVSIDVEVKKENEENKDGSVIRSERYYGRQCRSFSLSQDVDDTKAEAKYNNGVLELTLPKKPGTKNKQLTIN